MSCCEDQKKPVEVLETFFAIFIFRVEKNNVNFQKSVHSYFYRFGDFNLPVTVLNVTMLRWEMEVELDEFVSTVETISRNCDGCAQVFRINSNYE